MDTLIILVAVVATMLVYSAMAGNPAGHERAFRTRRFLNWLPLGLVYSFLYMGRYNLTVSKNALGALMSKEQFGVIFAAGTITYAVSFLVNGPITDRIGGKRAILIGAFGSMVANGILGLVTYLILSRPDLELNLTLLFSIVYSVNMYFQSFGAVSIVKVNSNWFHVRERGSFGGLFGVLISLGIYFAFDWGQAVVEATTVYIPEQVGILSTALGSLMSGEHASLVAADYGRLVVESVGVRPVAELGPVQSLLHSVLVGEGAKVSETWWVFWIPSLILCAVATVAIFLVRDRPSQAGFEDFDTGDASSGEESEELGMLALLKKIFTYPIIITIALIEFCSGVLRNGIMHWYPIYAKEIGLARDFFFRQHWGLVLCVAGISGGMLAGFISDKLFGSRRGPVAALLYATMLAVAVSMIFLLTSNWGLGLAVAAGSLAIIGVHGMLSGTATMDFGGRKAAGTAVGIIDGFVYLGTGLQSLSLGFITSRDWQYWPVFLVPFALVGLILAIRIWTAIPDGARKGGGGH